MGYKLVVSIAKGICEIVIALAFAAGQWSRFESVAIAGLGIIYKVSSSKLDILTDATGLDADIRFKQFCKIRTLLSDNTVADELAEFQSDEESDQKAMVRVYLTRKICNFIFLAIMILALLKNL